MKKWLPFLIISFLVCAVGFAPLEPTATLSPTDDTYVDINDPDPLVPKDGFGLKADYSFMPGFVVTRSVYLRFDLSSVTKNAAANSVLVLHVVHEAFNSEGYVSLWSTGDDWNGAETGIGDETSLKYSNAPPPDVFLGTRVAGEAGANMPFTSFALVSYVNSQREANGGDNIASFIVQWDSCTSCGQFDSIRFEDRENYYGSDYIPQLVLLEPTAATISAFTAQAMPRYNLLEWRTLQELDIQGFNIYRELSPDGEKVKINTELIQANKTGSLDGDDYEFEDPGAPPGATCIYWLELAMLDGSSSQFASDPVDTYSTLFLPTIRR